MAVIKAVHSKASIGTAIDYVTKDEKVQDKENPQNDKGNKENLISGIDCNPQTAKEEMQSTKGLWNKTGGRQYEHYVHSFASGENVTPKQAHEIANKWAEKEFKGHECLLSTHVDKGHIHTHVIVNTVNHENGKKRHTNKHWLQDAKDHSDEICRSYGLQITEKGKTFEGKPREDMTSFDKDKYQFLQKAEGGNVKSYVVDTAVDVMQSKSLATSKEDFINRMAEKGYKTEWKDNHKNITFTDKEGNKVRNSNIEKTFHVNVAKEDLENEFKQNRGRENTRTATDRGTSETPNHTRADSPINGADTLSKNEPIRSGADESRKYTTQADVGELHKKLQDIRGLDKKYNPKEQRSIAEQSARAERELKQELERARNLTKSKAQAVANKQRPIEPEFPKFDRGRSR